VLDACVDLKNVSCFNNSLLIVWFIFVLECIQGKLQGLVSADIRQILIETHGLPSLIVVTVVPLTEGFRVFDAFTDNNFAMFSKDTNIFGGGIESNSATSSCTDFGDVLANFPALRSQSSFQLDVLKRFLFSVSHPCQPPNPSTSYIYTQTQILKTKDRGLWNTVLTVSSSRRRG
jgi:hypothetical protein